MVFRKNYCIRYLGISGIFVVFYSSLNDSTIGLLVLVGLIPFLFRCLVF